MNISELFKNRVKEYFGDNSNFFINKLQEPCTQGFFLNTLKTSKKDILDLIDFNYKESNLNIDSYYHDSISIGKSKAYTLGLIYPQDVESSLFTNFIDNINPKLIVDMCAAPGGKTINILNKYKDALCITNDINYKRAKELLKNLERLGLDNTIITNKTIDDLTNSLKGNADIVILDAPCSGEGMIRKYPQILDNYNLENIKLLASIQRNLLENAYLMLSKDGILIYSTCTYAHEEDEEQIKSFLLRHNDMKLVPISNKNNYSKLEGTIKLCPLNDTEGQFISIMKKESMTDYTNIKELKRVKNRVVDNFINYNLNIENYYLYNINDNYYLSLNPLYDLKNNVIRSGIYLGELIKDRFEPSHSLYRSNSLRRYFKYIYDLNNVEYESFIRGNELNVELDNNYYLITYNDISLGFGKVSNKRLKNKYPKGLRVV